jgi:hypothetical protein
MSSIDIATGRPLRRDETVQIALLLAFTGGYLDAYTWIVHGVMANTQTANLVLLWVNAMAGKWQEAFHFVPSLFAFMVGVALSSWLRRAVGGRAGQISLLVEISMLILVAVLTCARCCRHAWCLHGRRHADVDLHQGRRLGLQLCDDNRQSSPGDRGRIRRGRAGSAGRAVPKILHLHGTLRHVRYRGGRRCLHYGARAESHPRSSRSRFASRPVPMPDIASG